MSHIRILLLKAALTLVSLFAITSCNKDDERKLPLTVVSRYNVFDLGNVNNATDIVVELGLQNSIIAEARLIISKSGDLNEAEAKKVNSTSYSSPALTSDGVYRLGDIKTFEGQTVENSIQYYVYVYLVGKDHATLLVQPKQLTLQDKAIYAGKYVGSFQDNFGIKNLSLILAENYSGPMYYRTDFTPFCGIGSSDNDGSMTFQFSGLSVTSLHCIQNYPCFMNGCQGSFDGAGSVINLINLDINYSGNDCEGAQAGRILLKKIE